MDLVIRPARPEDKDAVLPLIYSSGPDAFNYVFAHQTRRDALGFLDYAFPCNKGEFCWPVHWVVEFQGEIIATAAGYSGRTARVFLWPTIRQIVHCYGLLSGARVIKRGLQIERIVQPPRRADLFYITNVGVSPALRGRGIGQKLLEHLHEEGRKQGALVAALDVSMENPRAEALYTRLGYQVTKETPSTLKNATGHVPSHRRMELRLSD